MSRWVVLTRGIYGCDNASQPSTVSDGTNTTSYGYLANSSLAGQIVFQHNGATVMTTMSL